MCVETFAKYIELNVLKSLDLPSVEIISFEDFLARSFQR